MKLTESVKRKGLSEKIKREITKETTDVVKGSLHCSQFFKNKSNDTSFMKYHQKPKNCLLAFFHASST